MATRDELTRILTAIGADNWNPNRLPVDYYLLNGVRSPGLFDFEGLEAALKWDILQGPGLSGGYPIFRGDKLSEFATVHRLYDDEDWAQFHVFRKLLKKPAIGRRPSALRILHPVLDLVDPPLRAVVMTSWVPPQKPDEQGVYTFRVNWTQFRKPHVSYAKPDAAKPAAVTDPVDQIIVTLTNQVQELAK